MEIYTYKYTQGTGKIIYKIKAVSEKDSAFRARKMSKLPRVNRVFHVGTQFFITTKCSPRA